MQNINFKYISRLLQGYTYSCGIVFCAITDPVQLVLLKVLCIGAFWKVYLSTLIRISHFNLL